jgi:hypothetical protein
MLRADFGNAESFVARYSELAETRCHVVSIHDSHHLPSHSNYLCVIFCKTATLRTHPKLCECDNRLGNNLLRQAEQGASSLSEPCTSKPD